MKNFEFNFHPINCIRTTKIKQEKSNIIITIIIIK
jgi:hypothetical protein